MIKSEDNSGMKRMNSKYALLLFLCLFLSGQTVTALQIPDGVELSLRLYNKRIYTPDSTVELHVGVINSSSQPFVFHVADNKIFSLDLSVKNLHNESLDPTQEYIRRRSSNQQVLYREIRLLPGEEYAFVINLSSFVRLSEPGVYFVQASMKPEIEAPERLDSNEITLHVRPGEMTQQEQEFADERLEEREVETLQRQDLPPDEVVRYMIHARRRGEWKKFFLYLDVQSLMLEHRLKLEQWKRRSDAQRQEMLEEYRDMLRSSMVNNEILLIPTSFRVVKYEVKLNDEEEAEVQVRSRFKYQDFTEIKLFTYYLHRREGYWEIYRYEVSNEGTE
jgi:hypothetical protein